MNSVGATSVVVTAVGNDLKFWTIINIGLTIILWWSLLTPADVDKGGGDAYPQNVDNLPFFFYPSLKEWAFEKQTKKQCLIFILLTLTL